MDDGAERAAKVRFDHARRSGVLDLSAPRAEDRRRLALARFPTQVLDLPAQGAPLRELWLSNHSIRALPATIGSLASLEVLCLRGNQLTSVPDQLGHLRRLRRLLLGHNNLVALPAAVGRLNCLEELYLDHNRIQLFPRALRHLRRLQVLSLTGNQIRRVPTWISGLADLVELHLDGNRVRTAAAACRSPLLSTTPPPGQLEGLPPSIASLRTTLCTLGLADNPMAEAPQALAALAALTTLRVPRPMRLGDATRTDVNAASADFLAGRCATPLLSGHGQGRGPSPAATVATDTPFV